MFIVGGASFETGMANKAGGVITRLRENRKQLILTIMVVVGLMSGVLSNTGTASVLIPVVIGVAAKSGFSRSRLLMPLVSPPLRWAVTPAQHWRAGNLIASALQNIGGAGFEIRKNRSPDAHLRHSLTFLTIGYRFRRIMRPVVR